MKLNSRKCVKYIILAFLFALGSAQPDSTRDEDKFYFIAETDRFFIQQRVQEIVKKIKDSDNLQDEEKLIADLWSILGRFYKRAIEITAFYYSGYYPESYNLYDQILFEIGRDVMSAGKILAWYFPALINNSRISWQVKVKKSVYIATALAIIVLWMKEFYKYSNGKQKRKMHRSSFIYNDENEHFLDKQDDAFDDMTDLTHRIHPPFN